MPFAAGFLVVGLVVAIRRRRRKVKRETSADAIGELVDWRIARHSPRWRPKTKDGAWWL